MVRGLKPSLSRAPEATRLFGIIPTTFDGRFCGKLLLDQTEPGARASSWAGSAAKTLWLHWRAAATTMPDYGAGHDRLRDVRQNPRLP
jgi:hypothetical protein